MTSIEERIPSTDIANSWIRDALEIHPGGAELTVTGSCMAPALPEGSKVVLSGCDSAPRMGDVVLLRLSRGLRLHRVVSNRRGVLRTKGDRARYLDPPSRTGDVLAICESAEGRAIRLLRVLQSLARVRF